MRKLENLLFELENTLPQQHIQNLAVSGSSVGWHIEHILLTNNAIINALKNSEPTKYKPSFRFSKLLVFVTGKIPRGRAKAPKVVTPALFNTESLTAHINYGKDKIQELKTLSPSAYFTHPFFGDLKLKDTIKFLEIHTKHHLNIIKDILRINN
ncbi:MAG: DinB family protein [Bacteroidetes bacterium]|nr:DinB family protein [Bacteroidota bacterium]